MRRALETGDAIRVNADLPLITDRTEMITPEIAQEMLKHNRKNRPINWRKVEEYAEIMRAGHWKLHAQGIVLDRDGNILTGQKRLWAVIKSGIAVYFRVSRGNLPETATLLDRGTPQTARDLAARETERRHSPTESSIARAISVMTGVPRPSVDDLALIMTTYASVVQELLNQAHRTKKSRGVLMILAAIAYDHGDLDRSKLLPQVADLAVRLDEQLAPHTAEQCWGRGAAFGLAMARAREIVKAVK
jgi:hypothetical protein